MRDDILCYAQIFLPSTPCRRRVTSLPPASLRPAFADTETCACVYDRGQGLVGMWCDWTNEVALVGTGGSEVAAATAWLHEVFVRPKIFRISSSGTASALHAFLEPNQACHGFTDCGEYCSVSGEEMMRGVCIDKDVPPNRGRLTCGAIQPRIWHTNPRGSFKTPLFCCLVGAGQEV